MIRRDNAIAITLMMLINPRKKNDVFIIRFSVKKAVYHLNISAHIKLLLQYSYDIPSRYTTDSSPAVDSTAAQIEIIDRRLVI